MLPDGFRIRCHDLHDRLPTTEIKNSGDNFQDQERLGLAVCKLTVILKLRDEMIRFLPGAKFLTPTSMDGKPIVGLRASI